MRFYIIIQNETIKRRRSRRTFDRIRRAHVILFTASHMYIGSVFLYETIIKIIQWNV